LANKSDKAAEIEALKGKFSRARSVILADYRGLNVAQMTDLRRAARSAGIEVRVVKNTLAARAAGSGGIQGLGEYLQGPTAAAFSYEDAVSAARLFVEFARTARQLELKGGVVEGRILTGADVRSLAMLPPREVLLGQVLGGLQAPLRNLAFVLGAPLRGLATAVDEVRKQRQAAAD
jgi:large subunit ribosomal protein L10